MYDPHFRQGWQPDQKEPAKKQRLRGNMFGWSRHEHLIPKKGPNPCSKKTCSKHVHSWLECSISVYCFSLSKWFVLITNAKREINDLATSWLILWIKSHFWEAEGDISCTNLTRTAIIPCNGQVLPSPIFAAKLIRSRNESGETTKYDDKTTLCESCIRLNFILALTKMATCYLQAYHLQ